MAKHKQTDSHYFPDLTWKSRCDELIGDLRKAEAVIARQAAEIGTLTRWQRVVCSELGADVPVSAAIGFIRDLRDLLRQYQKTSPAVKGQMHG